MSTNSGLRSLNLSAFFLCNLLLLSLAASALAEAPRLRVSDDHRYLVYDDGRPFFYLGDTAWELFHRLNREEADRYLKDRAAKGFTVIQAVALAELDGLKTPNPYGHRPLVDNDLARPDVKPGEQNDYWDHVDYIVDKAAILDMFIGMLPTWGDKWVKRWGVGPEIFTPQNAEQYGEWLGRRYRDKPIIWILGGDRNPDGERHLQITRAMARGLERGHGGTQFMTFHPQGRSNSATWFHNDDWLDFNMIQSGHERPAKPNYEFMLENLARKPAKPTLDGEPCYEDHPVKGDVWNRRNEPGVLLPWFDEWDVRRAAYESMLAGACGHTYGDHNIWQMWLPSRESISVARTPWPEALEHPGSLQMKYFRGLFESRPFWKLRSDQSLMSNGGSDAVVRSALAADKSFAVLYLPEGGTVNVRLDKLKGESVRAWWFNPRQNSSQLIGTFQRSDERRFEAPGEGRNNDWVLVLEDASQEMARLGSSYQHITPKIAE
jgi:hypothetical protein